MSDLEFYSKDSGRRLSFDRDDECFVIEQFQKWFVIPASADIDNVYFMEGEQYIQLQLDNELGGYVLPKSKAVRGLTGTSGKLTLYTRNRAGSYIALTPPLYVGPSSLSEDEFAAILDRLGQHAIADKGIMTAPILGQVSNYQINPSNPFSNVRHSAMGESLLDLVKIIKTQWNLVRLSPAREMKLRPQIVDMDHSHKNIQMKIIQRSIQRPDRRHQEILLPVEVFNTPENRFLSFVLQDIIRISKLVAPSISQRAKWLRSSRVEPNRKIELRYRNLWKERTVSIHQQAERLDGIAKMTEKVGEWAYEKLRESFILDAASQLSFPLHPSAKLISSKEYGPIYKAYYEYRHGQLQSNDPKMEMLWALVERSVRKTDELFEVWVFVELCVMLVERFGFEPIGETIFDLMKIVSGDLSLQEKTQVRFQFVPKDSSQRLIKIALTYVPHIKPTDCKTGKRCFITSVCPKLPCYREIMVIERSRGKVNWSELKPDISLDVEVSGQPLYRFILDAKYRRYASQNINKKESEKFEVESVFDWDLLGTAKMKYLDGLDRDASFVIHSDPDPQFTFWGNDKCAPPHRERGRVTTYYPAHRFGAIYVSPNDLQNLEKLLRCLLMYHAKVENVCWQCRRVLTLGNGLSKHEEYVGDYYQCPDCGNFWIGTVCKGCHRPLIKMGKASFHLTKSNDQWSCICPACGDQFATPRSVQSTAN